MKKEVLLIVSIVIAIIIIFGFFIIRIKPDNPPTISKPRIFPGEVFSDTTLIGAIVSDDSNDEFVDIYFKWYKNNINCTL